MRVPTSNCGIGNSKGWIRLERGAVMVLDIDSLTDIAEGDFGDT